MLAAAADSSAWEEDLSEDNHSVWVPLNNVFVVALYRAGGSALLVAGQFLVTGTALDRASE